jgi:hypothetical protein
MLSHVDGVSLSRPVLSGSSPADIHETRPNAVRVCPSPFMDLYPLIFLDHPQWLCFRHCQLPDAVVVQSDLRSGSSRRRKPPPRKQTPQGPQGADATLDDKDCPPWVYLTWSIGLFLYQTFDAVDGSQARRTHQSGPLGELFDHGKPFACRVYTVYSNRF